MRDLVYKQLIDYESPRRPTTVSYPRQLNALSYRSDSEPTLYGVRYDRSLKLKLNRRFRVEFLQCVAEDARAVIGISFVEEVVSPYHVRYPKHHRLFPGDLVACEGIQLRYFPRTLLHFIRVVEVTCNISREGMALALPPSTEGEGGGGSDYAPIPTTLSFLRSLQNVRDITIEIIMDIDPVHGDNYSIPWLNTQIQPLALLPANNTAPNNVGNTTIIKINPPLYDSRAPLSGNRLGFRPYFFAVPGGPEAPWWLHHDHDWEEADVEGEKRYWKCLVKWDGGHRFRRFDGGWWVANLPAGR